MSKKSNMKRTQRRRKTKAYNAAKVATHRENVAKQQEEARKAYREMKTLRQKRIFTTGAKAVVASIAIMLMFLAGLVSWSIVRTAKQRRDEQIQHESQSPSQMVTSDMVTGMTRPAVQSMAKSPRFAGFARTEGGYDGKSLFGGRVSAEGIDDLLKERQRLEDSWQKSVASENSSDDDATFADQAKKKDKKTSSSDANRKRYQTEDDATAPSTVENDEGSASESEETAVTDEQIRKLIESSESSTSQ